jgi:hypothetical protein
MGKSSVLHSEPARIHRNLVVVQEHGVDVVHEWGRGGGAVIVRSWAVVVVGGRL